MAFLALGVALDALDDIAVVGHSSSSAFCSVTFGLICEIGGLRRWWRNERALRRTQAPTRALNGRSCDRHTGKPEGTAVLLLTLTVAGKLYCISPKTMARKSNGPPCHGNAPSPRFRFAHLPFHVRSHLTFRGNLPQSLQHSSYVWQHFYFSPTTGIAT